MSAYRLLTQVAAKLLIHYPGPPAYTSHLMCQGRLRGSGSAFGELIHARLEARSRLDGINMSPVMWPLVSRTTEALLRRPRVSGPPLGQACLHRGKADHLATVYLEKTTLSADREAGFIKRSLWLVTSLAKRAYRGCGNSVFTFCHDVRINSGIFPVLAAALAWISSWAFM